MMEFWKIFGWPLIFTGAVAAAYFLYIKPTLAKISATMGKDETVATATGISKFSAVIANWKTIGLAGMAAAIQLGEGIIGNLDTDTLAELKDLPWASVFTEGLANKVSLVLTFLIPISHVAGKLNAAVTPPRE